MDGHNLPYRRKDLKDLPSRPIVRGQATRKEGLVDIGLSALAGGQWLIIAAITRIIQARGWGDE